MFNSLLRGQTRPAISACRAKNPSKLEMLKENGREIHGGYTSNRWARTLAKIIALDNSLVESRRVQFMFSNQDNNQLQYYNGSDNIVPIQYGKRNDQIRNHSCQLGME